MATRSVIPNTSFSHSDFLLFAFPGISAHRHFLGIPFFTMFVLILIGNIMLINRIWRERSLQYPMYVLISVLFLINISCSMVIMPKLLLGLAFGLNQISLSGCLVQMYFIYVTLTLESSVVLVMSFDRYVAICRPLHYQIIITKRLLMQLAFISCIRCVIFISPSVILVSRVQFCRSNVIFNIACENMGLLKLSCGDISRENVIGLILRLIITVVDGSIILGSYLSILHSAIIISGKARSKALNTCGTHLTVALLIYSCGILSSIVYRMEQYVSVDGQNLTSAIFFLFPPTINPFIYGLKVKEIRDCLEKSYLRKRPNTETLS